MKKNLCLIAVLSALTAPVMADPVDWLLQTDTTLDGNVVNEVESTLEGLVHKNQFYFVDQAFPQAWNAVGHIEPLSNAEIGSGTTPRINFSVNDTAGSTHYLGANTDTNQYQGTWFGPNGTKGDFLLKPASTAPQPPTNDLVVSSITASTEGYGAAYGAAKAIDGVFGNNSTNVWFSAHADATPSLTMDMGSSIEVSHYQWSRGYCSSQGWLPGTWTVQGSNDSSAWTTIDVVLDDQYENYPLSSCTEFGEMEVIDTPGNYRYYRINFVASSVSSSAGVSVGEIKLWN